MARNRLFSFCLAGLCCCASGRVSLFANGIMMERMDAPGLYAGVRTSSEEITKGISEASSAEIMALNLLMVLDLPLEAAMDTLLIPWVIFGTIQQKERAKAFSDAPAISDEENGPSDGPSVTIDEVEQHEAHAERQDYEK